MPDEAGVTWEVGQPGCGKTHDAMQLAAKLSVDEGWPVLAVAGVESDSLRTNLRPATDIHQVLHAIASRADCYFCPQDLRDADAVFKAVQHVGRFVLIVDEAHMFMSSRSNKAPALMAMLRTWRHVPVRIVLTTQHLSGDVPSEAISCAPRFRFFRTTNPRALDKIRELGVDSEAVSKLPKYSYLEHFSGFA
jgi:hypothetical protein